MTQLTRGLVFLHSHKHIHRDLKPGNIFIKLGEKQEVIVKIGDFGTVKKVGRTTQQTRTGTEEYIAPEVWNEDPYSYPCDIFSLGIILIRLAECFVPFDLLLLLW